MEEQFWALAPQAQEKGIAKSRMGQLAKLCNDYRRALSVLRSALKTKNASAYLGKVIANIKEEIAPPAIHIPRSKEPEIILQGRLHGWPVRKVLRSNGEIGWYMCGTLYDRSGVDVGA